MSKNQDGIELQYNEYPYPEPILNMDQMIDQGYKQGSCLELIWHRLFPEKEYQEDLNILIAGCGTNQAVYHALRFPRSQHYAIDVSDRSISHVRDMIEKYNIKNLIVEKKDILELDNRVKFDYVISTGVIHHTKDPQKSLNKLVEITKDDGALYIMVYAIYNRVGIYFLQDVFKYLALNNTKEDINIAKRLIELSPKNHYARNYLDAIKYSHSTPDMDFDSGIVDTFLNARDVSFNINELKILIENSGSYFQGWDGNGPYYKKLLTFGTVEKLNKEYMNLTHWDLSDFTQKMFPSSGKFSFFLRKNKKYQNRFFNIEELINSTYARRLHYQKFEPDNYWHIEGVSKDIEEIVWSNINNKIEVILKKTNEIISKKQLGEKLSFNNTRAIIHHLWKDGKISLSDK